MFTNAQVIEPLRSIDARLARLEAALLSAPVVGAPVTQAAASPLVAAPLTFPEKGAKAARYACSKHPDHKGRGWFTSNGMAFHRANGCDGVTTAVTV